MNGLGEYPGFDASSQAREQYTSTPTSQTSPKHNGESRPDSRKRKRNDATMEDLLKDSFVVQPYPSTILAKSFTLRPIALLPRVHLPLSCLDTSPMFSNTLPQSRLFEAHVKILELEQRMGTIPMVLITRLDDGKSLFAVEWAERGLYALCRLGSWINLEKLCEKAVISRNDSQDDANNTRSSDAVGRGISGHSQITPQSSKYSRKKRLAIEAIQSLVKRQPIEFPSPSQEVPGAQPPLCPSFKSNTQDREIDTIIPELTTDPPASTDILENVRSQYLEALYLSKDSSHINNIENMCTDIYQASLAYFAKGPLSRARAAFHLDYDSNLNMKDLVEFLETLVLSPSMLDKKYKDGVPKIVSKLGLGSQGGDESEGVLSGKKRKARKIKLGKNGLYPAEDALIRRWCDAFTGDYAVTSGPQLEDITRQMVSQLRVREAQLQIIVLLETMALQPVAISSVSLDNSLPNTGLTETATEEKAPLRIKARKPQDLLTLIDLHVEKLSIWQTFAAEERKAASRTLQTSSSVMSLDLLLLGAPANDVLREFCVEVIAPFFSARLPAPCSTICRKLGSPLVVPSTLPALTRSVSLSGGSSRPGAVTKRAVTSATRRSLQRVLTSERRAREGSRGPSGAISLMRSATAPSVPTVKREGSEAPSLTSTPSIESQSIFASRGGVQKSKKFSQREVDLSKLANGIDSKSKKANIEAELKDAISALKRPNRQLAGQTAAEIAERRAASAALQQRKSKKPVRNPLFQGVQVLSTPKGNRQKDVVGEPIPMVRLENEDGPQLDVLPPSSIPRIPQSAVRPAVSKDENGIFRRNASARSNSKEFLTSAVQATPSRPSLPPERRNSDGFIVRGLFAEEELPPARSKHLRPEYTLDSPLIFGREMNVYDLEGVNMHATPVKQRQPVEDLQNQRPLREIGITPNVSNNSILAKGTSLPIMGDDDSIYKALGWDDVDELG